MHRWPSAAVLASLAPQEIPAGARVLELGAGTGLAGLVFASRALCGAVTLSDRKGACLANLREAVAVNDFGACDVTVERVDFCAPPSSIADSVSLRGARPRALFILCDALGATAAEGAGRTRARAG